MVMTENQYMAFRFYKGGINMKKIISVALIAFAVIVATGCASTNTAEKSAVQAEKKTNANGVEVAGYKTTIRDWSGRTVGTEAVPGWLEPATRGNFTKFIAQNDLSGSSSEYRLAVFDAGTADVRGAEMRVEMAYARKIARELSQSINTWAAQSTNSGSLDTKTRDAISERTQTQSTAEITGHKQIYQFWQIVEIDDGSGKTEKHAIIYQIYQINPDAWAKTVAKYIKQVVGDLPNDVTVEQSQVNDMLKTMMNDAHNPIELTQQQQKQALEADKKMLDLDAKSKEKDIDLKDEQLEKEKQLALVTISQNGETERTKIRTDAATAQTKSLADAKAVAYASGNPVAQQAASITKDDADWVNAMSLAQNILGE